MADKNVQLINYGAVDNLKPKTDASLVAIADEDGDSSNVEREIISLRQWQDLCYTRLSATGETVLFYNARGELLDSIDLSSYALKADSVSSVEIDGNTLTFKDKDGNVLSTVELPDLSAYALKAESIAEVTKDGDALVFADCDGNTISTIDLSDIVADTSELQSEIDDIKGWIGYQDEDVYGVEVDMVNYVFTRLAGAADKEAGADFDEINAFGGRKRCNLTDDGVVTAYYGDAAYTTSGALTQAVTVGDTTYPIGTNVQVMVEQPAFYYKVVPLVLDGQHIRKARYYVSDKPVNGFKLHPAFVENGKTNDKIYLAAYEGCLQNSSSYILDDTQSLDLENSKFSSISGSKPASGVSQALYRSAVRTTAHNRGAGWECHTVQAVSASQLLMLVEFAYFNMQRAIGFGINGLESGSGNESLNTGGTDSLGNATGSVFYQTVEISGVNEDACYVSYRGEENLWGNMLTWVDGLNIKNPDDIVTESTPTGMGQTFIADHDYKDDTDEFPYVSTGIYHPCGNENSAFIGGFGYCKEYDSLFIPSFVGGNSELPVGDRFWGGAAGWRVAAIGDQWGDNYQSGGFCWYLDIGSANRTRYRGGRLVFIPSKVS